MTELATRAVIFDYFGVLANEFGRPDREVIRFITDKLDGKYKLAVLSNMSNATAGEMLGDSAGLFDQVLTSGDLGVAKPDSRAFLIAANQLGEVTDCCLMIDDSQVNCAVAEELGMRAIIYDNLEQLQRELEKYGILTP